MGEASAGFAGLLRERRTRARLAQQELADAAGISLRTVSDLERGVASTPQKETVRLLADALHLIGPERAAFETTARGRPLPGESLAAAAAATRSLPRDISSFTGRRPELDQLAKSAMTVGGVVNIHAIGGMAGVGKTAFAVHAAHQLAGEFPGGQVFLPLHGHLPGHRPVEPADALASLLLAIGVPAGRVPPGLEARAALWRDRVAGQRLLLVLDDAATSEQVEPLLPGAGGSLVLITSRRHLSALDGATTVSLDTLPPGEAAALLVRLAGRPALGPGERAVGELARLCGFLPLAVGMMARQLRHHPAWTVAGRVAELAAARDRLELMETENLSVTAAFDLSYANLTGERQRLFRRLGLHPGPDVDGYAAAALDGGSLSAARSGLEGLYDQYLLTEPAAGRYRLHDLLREHARALAGRLDPPGDREAGTARLLDYYQRAGAVANARLRHRTVPDPVAGVADPAAGVGALATVPALPDYERALAWARTERASLLACLDLVSATGDHARVVGLSVGIGGLLEQDGPGTDAVALHTAAVQAAGQLGDQLSLAAAVADLGEALRWNGDYPAAVQAQERAIGLYRDLGHRPGQAWSLSYLGRALTKGGDAAAAVRAHEEALAIYRELGDVRAQAGVFEGLGEARRLIGDYPGAVRAHEEALAICQEEGHRIGASHALFSLGMLRLTTGDYPAAVQVLEQALDIYREREFRVGEANALLVLGEVWRQTGDYPATARVLEEALATYQDLGDRLGQANVLNGLGGVRQLTGDYSAAAESLDQALDLYRRLGSQGGEAMALNERGTLHRVSGELAAAGDCHQRSLDLSREIHSPWDEAHALAGLGRCCLADGNRAQAADWLREALDVFQRIGAHEADGLRAELSALTEP